MAQEVVLVDDNDIPLGTMDKIEAHKRGLLHRAFSVFIVDQETSTKLMLQQRSDKKYHSSGLWTNTCCSHPAINGNVLEEARVRLNEEMGFEEPLCEMFSFIYKEPLDKGLIEYEFDHVLFGKTSKKPVLNLEEAQDWKWVDVEFLKKDIEINPDIYSVWLKICFQRFYDYLKKNRANLK